MKKINLVIACLLGIVLAFVGCASTPQSEAYLSTPIGDGSESGFVMTTTLPDGTTREMHLFKTPQECEAYAAKIGFDIKRWHMKFDASFAQKMEMFKRDAKFNENGYYAHPFPFDEVGKIGKVMKEKGLSWSICALKNGSEWRTIGVVAQDKKYTLFRFSIIDYIDEEAYQVRLAAKEANEEKRQREMSTSITQDVTSSSETFTKMLSERQRLEQETTQRQKQIQADLARQVNEQKQRQTQTQQANQRNSPNYHDNNRVALSNYFNEMGRTPSNPATYLNRSTYISEAELARYEQLIESGVPRQAAAQQVYNEFRK